LARILVVDDADIVRVALVRALNRLGHLAEGTSCPRTALGRVVADPPDLLVLDNEMPAMSGPDLLRRARALLGDRCPPTLFVSGSTREEVMARVPRPVRAAFLPKPWSAEALFREVSALLTPSGAPMAEQP
jgi:CheY-like chemotaxis protein